MNCGATLVSKRERTWFTCGACDKLDYWKCRTCGGPCSTGCFGCHLCRTKEYRSRPIQTCFDCKVEWKPPRGSGHTRCDDCHRLATKGIACDGCTKRFVPNHPKSTLCPVCFAAASLVNPVCGVCKVNPVPWASAELCTPCYLKSVSRKSPARMCTRCGVRETPWSSADLCSACFGVSKK